MSKFLPAVLASFLLSSPALADEFVLVPAGMSTPLIDMASSEDATHLDMQAGHVGLLAGSGARDALWPVLTEWLAERSS